MSSVLNDLRLAIRQYARLPAFAFTVVGTLGLTIGATTAVFSVANTVLFRALPFASPERLVWIASVRTDNPSAPFSLPEFMDYRSRARTLTGIAAYSNWSASLAGDDVTERLQGARVSANAFEVLGVSPAARRLLMEDDDRPDATPVVVLSYRLWHRRYGAGDVVGTTARINGASYVIVGVLPPDFPLPLRHIDVVTPLSPEGDPLRHVRNSVNFLRVFGRLSPGVDAGQARVELTATCRTLREQFPVEYARKEGVRVDPLHEVLVGDYRQSMLLLLAAVTVVLATALSNLVSLSLVRANGRRAEVTLRMALRASRLRLARQFAAEALVLAAAGSALGWVVATQAISVGLLWAPASIPRLEEAGLDGAAAALVGAVTALVTALLTAAPLCAAARTGSAVRPANRGALGDRWNHRVRNLMVAVEIAAALVLLLATLALVQNLRELHDVHPGFHPDGIFQARVSLPPAYRSPEDVSRFYDQLSERIRSSPGVDQVGIISVAPMSGLLATVPFSVAGQTYRERGYPSANLRAISPGYLSTVGTRLVQGRPLSETDRPDTPRVALVSAALADLFLSGHAVGQRLLIDDNNAGPRPVEIVGVVENVRQTALDLPPTVDVCIPLRQIHRDGVTLFRNSQFWMVRTGSNPAVFRSTFLAHLRAVDRDAAASDAGPMRQILEDSLGPRRFLLGLFGAFALTATLLAVVGLYGLVSYGVSQRTPEIGLRLALGATPRSVQRMVLRQAAGLGLAGAVLGLGLAGGAYPFVSRMTGPSVGHVSVDAAAIAGAAVLVNAVVLVAAWWPARRAARIEPTATLRAE